MRELIFRGWDKINKKIICPSEMDRTDKLLCWWTKTESDDTDIIIMEYAGRADMHGELIFEGDIVTSEYKGTGVVVFRNSCFMLDCPTQWQYVGRLIEPEIVGNIYANPELIPPELKDATGSFIDTWKK